MKPAGRSASVRTAPDNFWPTVKVGVGVGVDVGTGVGVLVLVGDGVNVIVGVGVFVANMFWIAWVALHPRIKLLARQNVNANFKKYLVFII
jgi:hypothetical protein